MIFLVEGTNGILPNLDLVNVMVYLCHAEEIKSAFHDQVSNRLGGGYMIDSGEVKF